MSSNLIQKVLGAGLRPSPGPVIAIFASFWCVFNGTSIKETSLAICFLFFQTAIGTTVLAFARTSPLTSTGKIAIGFAFGALLVTLVDQLIINTGLPSRVSTIILVIFGTLCSRRLRILSADPNTAHDWRLVLLSPVAVVFGLAVFDKFQVIATIPLLAALVVSYLKPNRHNSCLSRKLALIGVVSFSLVVSLSKLESKSTAPWFLHQLFAGSDDQVFSQSIGWSLANYGLGEYPSAIGTSIRYHWFSLAWSGFIERFANAQPFATSLYIVPTVAFIMIFLAFVQLALLLTKSSFASVLSALVLLATSSTIEPYRFINVTNISNLVPYMWVTVLAILLYALADGSLKAPYLVLPLLQGAILLAKSPYGVIALIASTFTLLYHYLVSKKSGLGLLIALWLTSTFLFLMFLYPHPWEQRSFKLENTFNGVTSDRPLHLFITLATFLTVILGGLAGLFITLRNRRSHAQNALFVFMCAGVLCGYLRFMLSGGSAEHYFLNVSFFCLAPIVGIGVADSLQQLKSTDFRWLGVVACSSSFLMMLEFRIHIVSEWVGSQLIWSFLPLTTAIAFTVLSLFIKRPRRGRIPSRFAYVVLAVVLGFSISNYLSQMAPSTPLTKSGAFVSPEELEALSWLRSNSKKGAVIATNQGLCADEYTCQIDQSRFLISAFSQRRVLIEGPRFVVGGFPYPNWVKDRISLSLRFHATPNSKDLRTLRDFGVAWFYDFHPSASDALPDRRWMEYGSIRFKNRSVTIVELNQNDGLD